MIKNLIQRLTQNWHPMRFVALGLGLFLAYGGLTSSEPALGLLSLFFLFQAAFNTGCMVGQCAGNTCARDAVSANEQKKHAEPFQSGQGTVKSRE
ncbi:hypothetical protein [Natronogracilivirga saccharolytica]|uniref:DUF2892 domain-containing protein n=1 Tax=Natronogracilivirga saccharolytica TaxID=2812953 RepID=A0A8J7SCY1_9BACT|nr:hypothetical protein [Natronogracilivirga saccharolytica]MBP3193751.1 hypothetical protein [Natronogracilivirga saccharolytica]